MGAKDQISADLAAQLSLPAIGEDAAESDILGQMLGDSPADDTEAAEPTPQDLGALEEEFQVLRNLKRRKEDLKEELSIASAEYEAQRERMMDAMKAQGTSQFKGAAGEGSCSIGDRYDTTVVDNPAFMAWVQEVHPELLTVNTLTRHSFIRKEYKDQGIPVDDPRFPPGIVAKDRPTLSVRAAARDGGKSKKKRK